MWHTPDPSTVPTATFTAWQEANFTPLERQLPGISGEDADPEHDGIPNGAEFLTGGNPKRADAEEALAPTIVNLNGIEFPGVTMRIRSGLSGISAQLQVSSDLQDWDELYDVGSDPTFNSSLIVAKQTEGEFTKLTVRDVFPAGSGSGARFYRITVGSASQGGGDGVTGTTELTFDIEGFRNFSNMDQGYGDRVTSAKMGGFSYGGSGGFTPNVEVSYGPDGADPAFWTTGYGDLTNILFEDRDRFGQLEITFNADQGFLVNLRRWDMSAFTSAFVSDPAINAVSVTDGTGAVLFFRDNLAISKDTHTRFDFNNEPLEARTLVLRFDSANLGSLSDDIAFDNIVIGQRPE